MTIIFGSQTGNARRLAEQLGSSASLAGLAVRVVAADEYNVRELKTERLLYLVISTQGEGDAPDHARGFYEFLMGKRAPRLDDLHFAVLGLGDSSYGQFCQVGRDLDSRLEALGATRLFERGDADVDIEMVGEPWLKRATNEAAKLLKSSGNLATVTPLRPNQTPTVWSRSKPFQAEVLLNQRISAHDAIKDIRHIELSLADSGLVYEPGDALGVWPTNPPALVEAILELIGCKAEEPVTHDELTLTLGNWLTNRREITRLSRPFVLAHAQRTQDSTLLSIAQTQDSAATLLADYQLADLLAAYPASWTGTDLIAALRPLTPRLYSIASSMKEVETEAHLTVARVEYEAFGRVHIGAASHQLCETRADDHLQVFIEPNERFRPPANSDHDIIMIGPGTGVAPFRGFLQERNATGARGRNWLFFGNPHLRTDFLYQVEWQQALKQGRLHRLDVAFSRDQREKVYVQHCLRRHGRDLYAWLQEGAHVYVCGDARRMARDVHQALREVLTEQGGKGPEAADEYLSQLMSERRYSRDVY